MSTVTFELQMAEVAVSGKTFALALERIHRPRPVPV
jgi:hypothetical protein